MQKIIFIINGKNYKRCEKFSILKKRLSSKFDISCLITERIADGIAKAKQAAESGAKIVIAVGGDGTINEVVNGLMLSNMPQKPIMGILPCGTGNDFCRTFKMRPLEESLLDIKTKEIDIAKMSFIDQNGGNKSRFFVNIGDIGVGALTVKIVNGSKKKLGSALTFYAGTIKAFLTYKHNKVTIKSDDFEYSGKITAVTFANGKFFGGGMGIAPKAKLDDGLLDITLVGNVKMGTFLKYFPKLQKQKLINHPEVHYYKTKTIEISPLENKQYPVEADGELFGFAPVKVEIIPKSITMLL